MDEEINIEEYAQNWTVELSLDNETRIFELHAVGPASVLKHFLVDSDYSVIDKLEEESEFDRIVCNINE